MKEGTAKELISKPQEFQQKLEKLYIVVANNTTTYAQLKAKDDIYKKVYIENTNGLNDRNRALNALEKGQLNDGTRIDAFASDAVIVQTLLKNSVKEKGDINHQQDEKIRPAFEGRGFVVFPSTNFPSPVGGDYLPYLSKEKYFIAMRKKDSRKFLSIIDNEVLADLDNRNSNLQKASLTQKH